MRKRRRSVLLPTILIIGVIVAFVLASSQVWTEVLWFDQIGYVEVFRTEWITRIALFLIGALVMGAMVWFSIWIAYRKRPIYASAAAKTPAQAVREQLESLRKLTMIGVPIVIGFFAGVSAASQWDTVLMWLNGSDFGRTDPQFGLDLSFYVFSLPWLRFVTSFLATGVALGGIGAIFMHYVYGGFVLSSAKRSITTAARVQISVTAAIFVLLLGVNYWLDRYSMLIQQGDLIAGAGYTDVHASIPAKEILAGVAVLVALLFILAAVRGTWRLPAIGVSLMLVAAIVVGGIYPTIIQRFQVQPNQQTLESEYIGRNIDATKYAYGLDKVEVTPYDAKTVAEAGALRSDAETTASIRLLDPTVVPPAFKQMQQIKQYYDFPDALSVDRYNIDGESRDTVIGVRELNTDGLGAESNWVNQHTVYTHGFGVVAAYGNTTGADGRPAFYEQGIPSTGALGDYEPRVYFGQMSPDYSIVGAPEGAAPVELDYPDDNSATGQKNTTYQGNGGPKIDNWWTQLLYAVKFGSEQIVFSDNVTSESQILYDRDPRTRVEKVAPYLTLDGRTYPAVVDKKLVWVVDGYTTSDQMPYSEATSLNAATVDSQTNRLRSVQALQGGQVNYIRNSVKATVNAYDGSVTLYAWDDQDPILKAWMSVFPGTVKPIADISGDLMSHLRYPEDYFKVQRELLTKYHVNDAASFFSGQDFWRLPDDPTVPQSSVPQPPYYLTMEMPGQKAPTFSLMSTFIPNSTGADARNVLTGFLAVNAEPGNKAGVRDPDYGTMRLLQLPRSSTVPGPGQAQANFNASTTVSTQLNLLKTGSTQVIFGNLLTLPMGGGLLYVEPVYIQSAAGTQMPLMRKVLVAFGESVGFADTLDEALDQVFKGDSGAAAGDAGTDKVPLPTDTATPDPNATGSPTATPAPSDTSTPTPSATTTAPATGAQADLNAALADAKKALEDSNTAMQSGDWTAYGEAQSRLTDAINRAVAAETALG